MTTSTYVASKAERLLAEGRVTHLRNGHCTDRRCVYRVEGDHGTYRVQLGDGWTSCACPAVVRDCSHTTAALLAEARRHQASTTPRGEPVNA